MDGQIPEGADSQTRETLHHSSFQRFPSVNHTKTIPFSTNLHNSDQAFESAFSRLTLSKEFRPHSQTPSLRVLPPTCDVAATVQSVPWEVVAFAENQPSFFRVQPQSNNGGLNGPLGSFGPHQSAFVGPEAVGFVGSGPYRVDHHPFQMMKGSQRQYFLHGKKPMSINASSYVHVSPSDHPGNFSCHGRSKYGSYFTLDSMRGKVVPLAKDQLWSGALSSRLEQGVSEEEIEIVLPEIMEFIGDLMGNQFGSRFVQMIFVSCNEDQRTRIVMAMTRFRFRFLSICFNAHGVRAMQKLLEMLVTPQQISLVVSALIPDAIAVATDINGQHVIHYCVRNFPGEYNLKLLEMLVAPQQISLVVSALIPDAIAVATDINGQHVIHYCIKKIPEEYHMVLIPDAIAVATDINGQHVCITALKNFLGSREYNMHLFEEISANCFKIATSQSGCCVLQSCVENSRGKAREQLINEIMANAVHLAEDPYGNYVVQRLIDMKLPDVTVGLLRRFNGHFTSLSCNKFASNVVEKFLKDSTEPHSVAIVMELLMSQDGSSLLLDPYGNFVIQTALSVSRGVIRTALFKLIEEHAPLMQSNLYGKKILASLEKMKLNIS